MEVEREKTRHGMQQDKTQARQQKDKRVTRQGEDFNKTGKGGYREEGERRDIMYHTTRAERKM